MTYNPESLPPTDTVIAAMRPDHPAAVADELHRLLAHCLVRDEEVRREREAMAAQEAQDEADEADMHALAVKFGVVWDAEFEEFTGGGMWAAKREGGGWRIYGCSTLFTTPRAALVAWKAR